MSDTRNKHYTRNQGRKNVNLEIQSKQSLQIIRDQNFYSTEVKVFERMKVFALRNINVPINMIEIQERQAQKDFDENQKIIDSEIKVNGKDEIKEESVAIEAVNNQFDKLKLGRQTSIRQTIQTHQQKLQDTIQEEYMASANTKLEIPKEYFKYKKLNYQDTKQVVPDFYIKYVEPTNNEKQNTVEKCWSFKEKMYECTEQKIQELKNANIQIRPYDFEWVIDIFEKSAINGDRQDPASLIESFRRWCPEDEVKDRVSDEVMNQVYSIWKTQREDRKNRSFIRYFWHYQDSVGEDNYACFQTSHPKNKTSLRCNIKARMNGYAGMFIERENAVVLSDLVSHIHQKTLLQLDVAKIEDDEFDRIIGKGSQSDEASTHDVSQLDDNEIDSKMKLPFLSKDEEQSLKEYDGQQYDGQCQLHTQGLFMSMDQYADRTLQPCVDTHRDIHYKLLSKELYTSVSKQQNKIVAQQLQKYVLNQNNYDFEFKEIDPAKHKECKNAIAEIYKEKFKPEIVRIQGVNDKLSQQSNNPDNQSNGEKPIKDKPIKPIKPTKLIRGQPPRPQEKPNSPNGTKRLQGTKTNNGDDGNNNNQIDQPNEQSGEIDHIDKPQPGPQEGPKNPVQEIVEGPPTPISPVTNTRNGAEQITIQPFHGDQIKKRVKKRQVVGHNYIRLLTKMLYHQKKDLNMEINPPYIEKSIAMNEYKPQNMEGWEHVKTEDTNSKVAKFRKRVKRSIYQDIKVSYEPIELMFDFVKHKQPQLDYYEKLYQQQQAASEQNQLYNDYGNIQKLVKENQIVIGKQKDLLRQHKKNEKKIAKLNKEFEIMKNRKFEVRRGRNNRIFYKSMRKTVFGYDSDDYSIFNDQVECGNKRQKVDDVKPAKYIDKYMMNQMTIIQDIQKHCKNKRLKKNILKMDDIRLMSNGAKVAIENPQFTNASSSYDRVPQQFTDPVIESVFKKTHFSLYKEIIAQQSNENLIRKGVIPQSLYQDDGVNQQLEDYDEYLHTRKTQVCTPTNSEARRVQKDYNLQNKQINDTDMYDIDPNKYSNSGTTQAGTFDNSSKPNLSQTERESILQKLHFQKKYNQSVSVYKKQVANDFNNFKENVRMHQKQQQLHQQPMQQLYAYNQNQQFVATEGNSPPMK